MYEIDGLSTEQLNDFMEMYSDWMLKNEIFGELDKYFEDFDKKECYMDAERD